MLSLRLPAGAGSAAVLLAGVLIGCAGDPPAAPINTAVTRPMPQVNSLLSRPDRHLVSFTTTEPSNLAATVTSLGGVHNMAQDLIVLFLPVQNGAQQITHGGAPVESNGIRQGGSPRSSASPASPATSTA